MINKINKIITIFEMINQDVIIGKNFIENLLLNNVLNSSNDLIYILINYYQHSNLLQISSTILLEFIRNHEKISHYILKNYITLLLNLLKNDINFDTSNSVSKTISSLLITHISNETEQILLTLDIDLIFQSFYQSNFNYVKEYGLSLINTLLRKYQQVLLYYVSNVHHLESILNLLFNEHSKNAFNIFYLFIINPDKTLSIIDFLKKYQIDIIQFLKNYEIKNNEKRFIQKKNKIIRILETIVV